MFPQLEVGNSIGVFQVLGKVRVFLISPSSEMAETDLIQIPENVDYRDPDEVRRFLEEALAPHQLYPYSPYPPGEKHYLWRLDSL